MTTALLTPPGSEPLSLTEIKAHLRIDHDHEDELLAGLLTAARQYVEHYCRQKIMLQVWRQYESEFPCDGALTLQVAPVRALNDVIAFDTQGQPASVDPSSYQLMRESDPTIVQFEQSFDPLQASNGLELDISVGMAEHAVDIDDAIKRAVLLLIGHWYEFRGVVTPQQQPVSIPPGVEALLSPYRKLHV